MSVDMISPSITVAYRACKLESMLKHVYFEHVTVLGYMDGVAYPPLNMHEDLAYVL